MLLKDELGGETSLKWINSVQYGVGFTSLIVGNENIDSPNRCAQNWGDMSVHVLFGWVEGNNKIFGILCSCMCRHN